MNQYSSVNSTAAAIAAATASGQPLNFSNNMVGQMPIVSMQQQLQQLQNQQNQNQQNNQNQHQLSHYPHRFQKSSSYDYYRSPVDGQFSTLAEQVNGMSLQ